MRIKNKKHKSIILDSIDSQNSKGPEIHSDKIKIGDSLIPGVKLKSILRPHRKHIDSFVWSPNGRKIAFSSQTMICILDVETGSELCVFEGHKEKVFSYKWSPDGKMIASTELLGTWIVWDVETCKEIFRSKRDVSLLSVCWSLDGKELFLGDDTGDRIERWKTSTWELSNFVKNKESRRLSNNYDFISEKIKNLNSNIYDLNLNIINADLNHRVATNKYHKFSTFLFKDRQDILTPNSFPFMELLSSGTQLFVFSFEDISIFDLNTGDVTNLSSPLFSIMEWSSDKKIIAFGDHIGSIMVSGFKQPTSLEGHTSVVDCISFSSGNQLLVSHSLDKTVRIWSCNTWDSLAVFSNSLSPIKSGCLNFSPVAPILASLGGKNDAIYIWELNYELLLQNKSFTDSVKYTTAKVVLVGDSGVGKTGLGWFLSHKEFREHSSTHGQQFWVIDDLSTIRADGTECEAVLWDFAGQHIYRPIHALYLDNVDLALLLFDPTNRQTPLKGVEFWLEQLTGKKRLPPTILVGARVDRGSPFLTKEELDLFCQSHNISGGYVATSAKNGDGLDILMELVKSQIHWAEKKATVTTHTFKHIKEFVLKLKEESEKKGVIVNPNELRQKLQSTDKEWEFSDDEMMTALLHLENHGYVTVLDRSSGGKVILLYPELLVNLASSIVLEANRHVKDLGAVNEMHLLKGDYVFPELENLDIEEKEVLLDAAVLRFLDHKVCFRETLGSEALLIFPGLIKQKRPLDDILTVEDVSYVIRGSVENVYSALVVLLGYTAICTRINSWQNQTQYDMGLGELCGFRQIEDREGEVELILYYGQETSSNARSLFQSLFERFLYQRDVNVTKYPPVYCKNQHLQERLTVIKFLREGKKLLFCNDCGERVELPEIEGPLFLGSRVSGVVDKAEALAMLRSIYEKYLSYVKAFRRDRIHPKCYISYMPTEKYWVEENLLNDLRKAGIYVTENLNEIGPRDPIVVICTPTYKRAFAENDISLSHDFCLIFDRSIDCNSSYKTTIIPLIFEGNESVSLPRELLHIRHGDFTNESHYIVSLFDLVLTLYSIPLNHPNLCNLREMLKKQWEKTLKEEACEVLLTQEVHKMEYNNFQLLITNDCKIRAFSKEGEISGELDLDFNKIGLTLELIEQAQTNAGLLKELGSTFFDALFPKNIHGQFKAAIRGSEVENLGLRLRLIIEPPKLSSLPWEFLYDKSIDAFIANDKRIALSRYIQVPVSKRQIVKSSNPLKILLLISSPEDLESLDSIGEENLVKEALKNHIATGKIELDVLRDATISNINQKMNEKDYNILHFIGHGIFKNDMGYIALVDNSHKSQILDEEGFCNIFLGNKHLGLIVLNSCQSAASSSCHALTGIAPKLVQRGIPAVIAMQYSILDDTAKKFADIFYRTLAEECPVDEAVQITRNAISLEIGLDKVDFATPVLFMRSEDGIIFEKEICRNP